MKKHKQNKFGFTIVELLIVIVVIAILAAISIVAYNGIQNRAKSTALSQMVHSYVKVFELYKVDNGQFPEAFGPSAKGFCVGIGYPNLDGDAFGDCISNYDYPNFDYNEDPAFNNSIKPYANSIPAVNKDGFISGGNNFNGLIYLYDPNIQIDGVWGARSMLFYYLPGQNQDCQYSVVRYVGNPSGAPTPGNSNYLFSTTNSNRYTHVNPYATACAIILN
jgi:prepilin-type N-terminal cleavage/methylation domain-containing protein